MLYHCFASFTQSLLDFFKLVDSRLILILLCDSINLISVGFTNNIWAVGVRKSEVERFGLYWIQDVPVRCLTETKLLSTMCLVAINILLRW